MSSSPPRSRRHTHDGTVRHHPASQRMMLKRPEPSGPAYSQADAFLRRPQSAASVFNRVVTRPEPTALFADAQLQEVLVTGMLEQKAKLDTALRKLTGSLQVTYSAVPSKALPSSSSLPALELSGVGAEEPYPVQQGRAWQGKAAARPASPILPLKRSGDAGQRWYKAPEPPKSSWPPKEPPTLQKMERDMKTWARAKVGPAQHEEHSTKHPASPEALHYRRAPCQATCCIQSHLLTHLLCFARSQDELGAFAVHQGRMQEAAVTAPIVDELARRNDELSARKLAPSSLPAAWPEQRGPGRCAGPTRVKGASDRTRPAHSSAKAQRQSPPTSSRVRRPRDAHRRADGRACAVEHADGEIGEVRGDASCRDRESAGGACGAQAG